MSNKRTTNSSNSKTTCCAHHHLLLVILVRVGVFRLSLWIVACSRRRGHSRVLSAIVRIGLWISPCRSPVVRYLGRRVLAVGGVVRGRLPPRNAGSLFDIVPALAGLVELGHPTGRQRRACLWVHRLLRRSILAGRWVRLAIRLRSIVWVVGSFSHRRSIHAGPRLPSPCAFLCPCRRL
ncbi:hypothetical protein ASPVEDRAFT_293940 [Aspergillus versicolor CBS 583.65]|uniref:Uncharacterized protein n=1 Tax=Aspergillus versicolor CBS 583.65 TaxID=1036611 RepID=A0A1L9P7H3_ASPVE|nr:uncharacterized protein ASPVEDRAFT_293940 [Aspergillus versicolor CBS 583.65]OJI97458.1 hypothetical protein ASPVEDRAFT_293940 [Aspergillus versicolor CBS 583.65]